jgi:hypothetical protein
VILVAVTPKTAPSQKSNVLKRLLFGIFVSEKNVRRSFNTLAGVGGGGKAHM